MNKPRRIFVDASPDWLIYYNNDEKDMKPERIDETLFKEKFRYVCGPFITCAANGNWLVTWNMSMELEIGPSIHPADISIRQTTLSFATTLCARVTGGRRGKPHE